MPSELFNQENWLFQDAKHNKPIKAELLIWQSEMEIHWCHLIIGTLDLYNTLMKGNNPRVGFWIKLYQNSN